MSRTIEETGNLIAEWQEGPKTISGYAPRKLRLTFAVPLRNSHFRLPTSSRFEQTALGATLGLSAKERI